MRTFIDIKDGKTVHLRQGDLDGACTVYSLMMGLIAIKAIKKSTITDTNKDSDRSTDWRKSYGRLIKEFFYKEPASTDAPETTLIRNGATLMNIQDKLAHSFNKMVTSWYGSSAIGENQDGYMDKNRLIEFITDEIDKGRPVEIAFQYLRTEGGHAVLAVGYEKIDGVITKLFCLDPGIECKGRGKYNAVIDIPYKGKRRQFHEQYKCTVEIYEALSFVKNTNGRSFR